MEFTSHRKSRQVNQWMNNYISPGPVGPIGDVIVNEKLKKSCPDLPPRYSIKDMRARGHGIQDGTWYNYHNNGLNANVERLSFYDQNNVTFADGFRVQDLRLQDLKAESRLLGAPQFGWKNQKATLLNARVTGEQFLPHPGGYLPSGVSRGPQPRSNILVDLQDPIGPLKEISKLPALDGFIQNVPRRDDVMQGTENIQKQRELPQRTSINATGFLSGRF